MNASSKIKAGTAGAITVALVTWVASFEGLPKPEANGGFGAYRDLGGVWTYCYGETSNVKPGLSFTAAQCRSILQFRLQADYAKPLAQCIKHDLWPEQWAAILDMAYNVGVEAICQSTLMRKWNAGDCYGAADEFGKWVKVRGVTINGLVKRRKAEHDEWIKGCQRG